MKITYILVVERIPAKCRKTEIFLQKSESMFNLLKQINKPYKLHFIHSYNCVSNLTSSSQHWIHWSLSKSWIWNKLVLLTCHVKLEHVVFRCDQNTVFECILLNWFRFVEWFTIQLHFCTICFLFNWKIKVKINSTITITFLHIMPHHLFLHQLQ